MIIFKGPLRSSKAEAGSFCLHWPDPPKLSVPPRCYLASLVSPVTMEKKRKKKNEMLLIGLYDLGNRMLLQMIVLKADFILVKTSSIHYTRGRSAKHNLFQFERCVCFLMWKFHKGTKRKKKKKTKLLSCNKVTLGCRLQCPDSVQIP